MRHLLSLTLLLALVGAGTALATRGDPQKEIVPADQARAKAMLLRKADLDAWFKATRSSDPDDDSYCAALDESDLTLTGEAESPDFGNTVVFISSFAQVYESQADADTSWRRGSSASGEKCARDEFRRLLKADGLRLLSFRRTSFPRLADRSIAYRLVASGRGIKVYSDVVILQESRAHAGLVFVSAPPPLPKAAQVEVARAIAGRMAKAMRGS